MIRMRNQDHFERIGAMICSWIPAIGNKLTKNRALIGLRILMVNETRLAASKVLGGILLGLDARFA